ncbi:MAG TPA: FAD-dependent thymidylate synthase [Terriglobales bacterium]|jgi:thymidylate synthase ThyX|nr:FAD-dependent thymidylate synthase [Terriglobales bacterium]
MSDQKPASNNHQPATNVYAVYGAEPEVQAYAMAKYSRSALSMKESLREINEQKAEKFLNTFYFQYGHRSIADLAHIAFAIEKLSMIAAIILVDEQRWDGQERSTRYQDFRKSSYYIPEFGTDSSGLQLYRETIEFLFAEYEILSEGMWKWLAERTPQPEAMKQDAYERTLKARAFDISRYLLPLGTNTSLGQIMNARTLETQISRLLSSEYPEVQDLGRLLKQAASEPAYNVNQESWSALVDKINAISPEVGALAQQSLLKDVRVSPTLVKYADPCEYEISTRKELRHAAAEIMGKAEMATAKSVDLLDDEPFEIELATTLLYEQCHYSYRQIRERVKGLNAPRREEIIALGAKHRGKHDELLRAFSAGQKFRFDILMDAGGFRDMHRHRRCVQIGQDFTATHGYDTPSDLTSAGLEPRYQHTMRRAADTAAALAKDHGEAAAVYVLPMAYRKRTLFKMDFAEAVYISELRTTPAGHFSYRSVAYAMYEAVVERYPALKQYFRVTDVRQPVDLLTR